MVWLPAWFLLTVPKPLARWFSWRCHMVALSVRVMVYVVCCLSFGNGLMSPLGCSHGRDGPPNCQIQDSYTINICDDPLWLRICGVV